VRAPCWCPRPLFSLPKNALADSLRAGPGIPPSPPPTHTPNSPLLCAGVVHGGAYFLPCLNPRIPPSPPCLGPGDVGQGAASLKSSAAIALHGFACQEMRRGGTRCPLSSHSRPRPSRSTRMQTSILSYTLCRCSSLHADSSCWLADALVEVRWSPAFAVAVPFMHTGQQLTTRMQCHVVPSFLPDTINRFASLISPVVYGCRRLHPTTPFSVRRRQRSPVQPHTSQGQAHNLPHAQTWPSRPFLGGHASVCIRFRFCVASV